MVVARASIMQNKLGRFRLPRVPVLAVSCLVALACGASGALADPIVTLNAGKQSNAFDTVFTATSVGPIPTKQPYYELLGSFETDGSVAKGPAPTAESATGAGTFDYDFSLGYHTAASPYVDLTLQAVTGSSISDIKGFSIIDLSRGDEKVTSVKWSGPATSGSETLTGDLIGALAGGGTSSFHDKFEIQLVLGKGAGSFFATGSVPVPGALVLFGSSLLVIGLLAARNRRPGPGKLA